MNRNPIVVTGQRALRLLAALCLLVCAAQPAPATTLLYKDFDALTAEAEGIVLGTVRQVESFYTPDRDIYTLVTLDNLAFLYGTSDHDPLVLRLAGGQVEGDILAVHGSPRFRPQERVLVFLNGNGERLIPIVGWTQGMFRIVPEPASGREVIQDHEGNRVVGITGAQIHTEQHYPPEAHILDPRTGTRRPADRPRAQPSDQLTLPVQAFSATQADGGSPGVTDDLASHSEMVLNQAAETAQPAIAVHDFLEAIAQKLAAQGKRDVPLIPSVDRAEVPRRATPADAAPREPEPGAESSAIDPPQPAPDGPFLPQPFEPDRSGQADQH